MSNSRLIVSSPSFGRAPAGFPSVHIEVGPKEAARIIGYDPRVLVMRPPTKTGRGTRDLLPANVSTAVIELQNRVQRSIDKDRVKAMVQYLADAVEQGSFAAWGPIVLVTSSTPESANVGRDAALDPDSDYFIADGQHRYCALLDFVKQYPMYSERFTQGLSIYAVPAEQLTAVAGQLFHDHNYFSVPVRAGKALSVDTRDPVNALAKSLDEHPAIQAAGGIAYERDTLLAGDSRFTTHSVMHRFTRGFLFGRPGLDKGTDTRMEPPQKAKENLQEYVSALGLVLPWVGSERDSYLTRASAVLSALSVVGHDLYHSEAGWELTPEKRAEKLACLTKIDWRRTNLGLVGVVGSEKNGQVQPASSRQAIDSTIRYLRQACGLLPA